MLAAGAPIDGFGIGTSLTTSSDAPALDCAYKLQEYAGVARRKLSAGKATWPGRKQVWRSHGADGRIAGDILSVVDDDQPGTPLLVPVMRGGRRIAPQSTLAAMRTFAAEALSRLPNDLRRLDPAPAYPVTVAPKLHALAEAVDRRLAASQGGAGSDAGTRNGSCR
ncbi:MULTISPECIES: hypothetical protein [Chelatococcus]|uniref:nicotinate phosphoribosyltransferase n=1 Tax=Chelatococcus caeni TaxID=1348468 RepID=A0A840BU85_9HYPH|nr:MULTISPECIES: hypothetical protein [Chelatococcus]MBB4016133.1 nicotinate phosphoribosyltransferase [Chelatococcus caeni]